MNFSNHQPKSQQTILETKEQLSSTTIYHETNEPHQQNYNQTHLTTEFHEHDLNHPKIFNQNDSTTELEPFIKLPNSISLDLSNTIIKLQSQIQSQNSREILLEAELIQLQTQCSTLLGIIHSNNFSLCNQNELMQLDESSLSLDSPSLILDQTPHLKSFMSNQQEIADMEKNVELYKKELKGYKKNIDDLKLDYENKYCIKNEEIKSLKMELAECKRILEQERAICQEVSQKNTHLLIKMESLTNKIAKQEDFTPSKTSPLPKLMTETPIKGTELLKSHSVAHFSANSSSGTYIPDFKRKSEVEAFRSYPYRRERKERERRSYLSGPEEYSNDDERECVKEMEKMINKLATNLQQEKSIHLKYKQETERLRECILDYERQIKEKNNSIYLLEKQLIVEQKEREEEKTKNHLDSLEKDKENKNTLNFFPENNNRIMTTSLDSKNRNIKMSFKANNSPYLNSPIARSTQNSYGEYYQNCFSPYTLNKPMPSIILSNNSQQIHKIKKIVNYNRE